MSTFTAGRPVVPVAVRGRRLQSPWLAKLSAPVLYLVATLGVYFPVLTVRYGFLDDYAQLDEALHGSLWTSLSLIVPEGRVLYALYVRVVFGEIGAVAWFAVVRGIGLVGTALLAWVLFSYLRRLGVSPIVAFVVPLLVELMPPFQVYAAWASASPYPFAGLAAAGGSFMVDRALAGRERQYWRLALASVLVFAGAAVYQPAAMVFWLFGAAGLLLGKGDVRGKLTAFAYKVGVMAAAFVLDYISALMMPPLLYGRFILSGRDQLATDPLAKGSEFLRALDNSLNLAKLVPSTDIAVVVGGVVAAGLVLYVHSLGDNPRDRALAWLLLAVVMVLAYSPNLVVALDWPAYRTQAPLTAVVVLYASFGLLALARTLSLEKVAVVVLAFLTVVAGFLAYRNVTTEFTEPQTLEWTYLANHVRRAMNDSSVRTIDVVMTSWQDFAPVARYDEFGVPTSAVDWATNAMAHIALAESGDGRGHHVAINVTRDPVRHHGTFVIDLRLLEGHWERGAWSWLP